MLAKGDIDIGFISFPRYEDDVVIEPLNTDVQGYNVYIVMPDSHHLANKAFLTIEDIKDEAISTLPTNFVLGDLLFKRFAQINQEPNIVYANGDMHVLLSSLHEFNSLCLFPIEYKSLNSTPNLKWIPFKDDKNYFGIGVGLNKHKNVSQNIRDLINIFQNIKS